MDMVMNRYEFTAGQIPPEVGLKLGIPRSAGQR